MISFSEALGRMITIYGAFSPEEARVLYTQAVAQGENAVFVEIGSYCGRSSSILGQVARESHSHLTCVDNFITGAPGAIDVKKTFEENMAHIHAPYELFAMDSKEAINKFKQKEIHLLFVDGDHRYIGTKTDCELWLPLLRPGGIVLFHDYESSWEGVKQAVDEFTSDYQLVARDQSIIAKRKPDLTLE